MRPKLLFIAPFYNGFIRKDLEILKSEFTVKAQVLNWKQKGQIPIHLLRQFVFMLVQVSSAKAVLIQFGGMWGVVPAFLASLLGKPIYVVLHGTDAASLPHYQYGSLRKPLVKWSCAFLYRKASKLVPVSASLLEVRNDYNEHDQAQGVKVHFPKLKFEAEVIPNGLDAEQWQMTNPPERIANRFIAVFNDAQFQLKGGDLILAAAKSFPQFEFRIAGSSGPKGLEIPHNVNFLGKLKADELKKEYYQASYHLQLSRFEGFGLALCEAMLCGCIAIGSSVNAIPEIIGEHGYILEKHGVKDFEDLLANLGSPASFDQKGIRSRIENLYPVSIRSQKLLALFRT